MSTSPRIRLPVLLSSSLWERRASSRARRQQVTDGRRFPSSRASARPTSPRRRGPSWRCGMHWTPSGRRIAGAASRRRVASTARPRALGVRTGRSRSPAQLVRLYGEGRRVREGNIEPGDILFFEGLGHVGLYLGSGRMVHAPQTGRNVEIVRLGSTNYGTSPDRRPPRRRLSHRRHDGPDGDPGSFMTKKRLDVLLVERGLAESRSQAQAFVLAGLVPATTSRASRSQTTPARGGAAAALRLSRRGEAPERARRVRRRRHRARLRRRRGIDRAGSRTACSRPARRGSSRSTSATGSSTHGFARIRG